MKFIIPYINNTYDMVKQETEGLDAVYEDYIIKLVGFTGLKYLKGAGLIETCGVVNGRQLYVLVEKGS